MISAHKNFQIDAIVACVPSHVERNVYLPFDKATINRVISSTGIKERRIADEDTTAADLCIEACRHSLNQQSIDKSEVGVLVFVTQYPDYILPSTAHIIKEKLKLPHDCIAIQINEGCAGYVYGLQVCLSLLESTNSSLGLILAGDTTTKVINDNDTGSRPIFGDAGSATLIRRGHGDIRMQLGSDGSGYEDIIVKQGGFRNLHNDAVQLPELKMNGMNVFAFGIGRVPKYITGFLQDADIDPSSIHYFVMHQANKMMNLRIARRLGFSEDQVPFSLEAYGNTSCASIPLTIASQLKVKLEEKTTILASGFGVGLSWGNAVFRLSGETYLEVIDSKN